MYTYIVMTAPVYVCFMQQHCLYMFVIIAQLNNVKTWITTIPGSSVHVAVPNEESHASLQSIQGGSSMEYWCGHTVQHFVQHVLLQCVSTSATCCAQCCRSRMDFYFCNIASNKLRRISAR